MVKSLSYVKKIESYTKYHDMYSIGLSEKYNPKGKYNSTAYYDYANLFGEWTLNDEPIQDVQQQLLNIGK